MRCACVLAAIEKNLVKGLEKVSELEVAISACPVNI